VTVEERAAAFYAALLLATIGFVVFHRLWLGLQ